MDKRLKASIVVAVLLAGAGAAYLAFVAPAIRADEVRIAQRRSALDDCRRAALMVYDVHWAAACLTVAGQAPGQPDGYAECDLPEDKAAVVNKWLDEAEARCIAEARAGPTLSP